MKTPVIADWALTRHAAERMAERNISISDLELTLRAPDHVIAQGPKFVLVKRIEGRKDNMIATVVIEKKEHGVWLVISVLNEFQLKK